MEVVSPKTEPTNESQKILIWLNFSQIKKDISIPIKIPKAVLKIISEE